MQLCEVLNRSVLCTLAGLYSFLWILSFVQSKTPDVHVTCVYSEDCLLPCSFTSSDDEVLIQWYQQETLIYSFQEDEDEPEDSNISLFPDEVSNGNASLLLKDSRAKSRGRYKCMVKTTETVEESVVIVKVEAPISRISIEDTLTGSVQCSSHGMYPAPVLTWSTEPYVGNLQPVKRMSADSDGLYSIESTLKKLKNSPLTYTCSITSKYTSHAWTASLLQTEIAGKVGEVLIVPCMAPKNLQKNFNLTWTFRKKGKSKEILSYNSRTDALVNLWDDGGAEVHLEKTRRGDGSLYLDDLDLSKHSGNYTCIFSGPQFKYIVQTSVSIDSAKAAAHTGKSKSNLWVLAVVVAALALLGVLFYMYRKYRRKSKGPGQDTEMQAVHKDKGAVELPAENQPLNFKEDSQHAN